MRLIIVRHGDPDYAHDCLTELGHVQAEAAAKRLMNEGISAIYSSTNGRALETAEHTSKMIGVPVIKEDFMREVAWHPPGITREDFPKYSPWMTAWRLMYGGADLLHFPAEKYGWENEQYYESCKRVKEGFNIWMESLGYKKEGIYYRCIRKNDDTVAVFAHGGSGISMISELTGLPEMYLAFMLQIRLTAISEFSLTGEVGDLIPPRIEILCEHRHIDDAGSVNVQQ